MALNNFLSGIGHPRPHFSYDFRDIREGRDAYSKVIATDPLIKEAPKVGQGYVVGGVRPK